MIKKQFEYKNGIAVRINNNPKGYNRHKKNPNPPVIVPEVITIETVQEAYRELRRKLREYLSASHKFKNLNKAYLGLDKIDKEFSENAQITQDHKRE